MAYPCNIIFVNTMIYLIFKEVSLSLSYQEPPTSRNLMYDSKLEKYLTNFGYLPQSDFDIGAMRTQQQLKDAVKNLQFFAGIDVTGTIDKNTLELIKKPRCGVPDVTHKGNGFANALAMFLA